MNFPEFQHVRHKDHLEPGSIIFLPHRFDSYITLNTEYHNKREYMPHDEEGNGNTFQYSWPGEFHEQAIVHGVAKIQTQLSNKHFCFQSGPIPPKPNSVVLQKDKATLRNNRSLLSIYNHSDIVNIYRKIVNIV